MVPLGNKALMEKRGKMALKVALALTEEREIEETQDRKVFREILVKGDTLVLRDQGEVREQRGHTEHLENAGDPDRRGTLVGRGLQDSGVSREEQEQRDPKVTQDLKVFRVEKETRGHQEGVV